MRGRDGQGVINWIITDSDSDDMLREEVCLCREIELAGGWRGISDAVTTLDTGTEYQSRSSMEWGLIRLSLPVLFFNWRPSRDVKYSI